VKPHVLVKGGDWAPDKIVGKGFVESIGGVVKNLTFVNGKSTTSLVEKIKKL
jgi:D-beta-D-heptose 7-phosphate kinase/D-beta-D-heptose 1-phosphate adenosyltransferase